MNKLFEDKILNFRLVLSYNVRCCKKEYNTGGTTQNDHCGNRGALHSGQGVLGVPHKTTIAATGTVAAIFLSAYLA